VITRRNHSVRLGSDRTTASIGFSTLTANISEAKLSGLALNLVSKSRLIKTSMCSPPNVNNGKLKRQEDV
jgi:hypothetical protein